MRTFIGVILMILGIIFFLIFMYWGVKGYNPDYAIGIIIVAIGTFCFGWIVIQFPAVK